MTLYYDVMIFIWCEAVIEREKIAKVIENDRQAHTHTEYSKERLQLARVRKSNQCMCQVTQYAGKHLPMYPQTVIESKKIYCSPS